jgi:protein O-mannosyl-transferase
MSREIKAVVVFAALLAALAVWVYWPAAHNPFVLWDDTDYLKRAMLDRTFTFAKIREAFTTVYLGNYHPLTTLSHALDCRLWEINPTPHHVVSVLLHGANAVLAAMFVWTLLRTAKSFSAGERIAMTFGVALAFAIHPLQVESVAWVSERKTLLCTAFSLACLIAYVKGARVVTLVLFALALLSKAMAAPLPVVMLLLDYYPLRRIAQIDWWGLVREKLPLFAMSAVVSVIAVIVQASGNAAMSLHQLGMAARFLVAARGVVFYAWKLLWPVALSPYYPLEGTISLREIEFSASAVICVAVSVLVVWRRQQWRSPFVAWFAYLALVAPTSGIVQAGGQAAADRYMYLAMLPLLLMIAGGAVVLWRRFTNVGRLALVGVLACNFAFWGFKTRAQIGIWHDDETLWRAALVYFPKSARVNGQVAMAMARQGLFEEALPLAQESVRAAPEFWLPRATLGFVYLGKKQYREAERELRLAVTLNPNSADSAVAQYDLACADSMLGEFAESYRALQEAVKLDARYGRVAQQDPDLEPLRSQPDYRDRFQLLVKESSAR